MRRIKTGDMVQIIAGQDKGNRGKVLSFNPETNKVVVEGWNMVSKHQKPSQANPQGGIIQKEAPMDASNVMLVSDGQPTRVKFEIRDGKKVRVSKKTGKVIG